MNKKLLRTTPFSLTGLKLREAEDGTETREVVGHAVVFGVRSVNLTPWSRYREVYEVMEPGCITQDLINRSDVVLTAFHNNEKIMGRSTNGKGTLKLSLDKRGMMQRCVWPEITYADDLLVLLKRGDISGMSFAFTADEEDTENGVSYEHMEAEDHDGKEVWVRHVKKVTGLYDVTVAGHPAYQQTDVAQREIDAFLDTKIGEPAAVIAEREAERVAEEARLEAERKAQEKREQEEREHLAAEMKRRERHLRRLSLDAELPE